MQSTSRMHVTDLTLLLLQLQEYVLWRLRDTPGQRTLSAFQQQPGTTSQAAAKPSSITAALPPSPYKQYAAAAAHSHRQHQSKQNVPSEPAQAVQLLENPTGHANNAAAVDLNTVRQTRDAQTQQQCLQSEPCESADPACALQAANAQTSTAAQHTESNDRANLASKAAATEPSLMPASMPRPVPATPVQPPAPPTSPPAQPSGISDDYKTAYKVAAAARAACDLLRGAPKSSRDDPHFMDSYYKSSRLSFIGRWKARIEALTAAMAGDAPVPQVAHQPLPLMNAFRQGKGDCHSSRCVAVVGLKPIGQQDCVVLLFSLFVLLQSSFTHACTPKGLTAARVSCVCSPLLQAGG